LYLFAEKNTWGSRKKAIFVELQKKVIFFLVAGPLKKNFFAASLRSFKL